MPEKTGWIVYNFAKPLTCATFSLDLINIHEIRRIYIKNVLDAFVRKERKFSSSYIFSRMNIVFFFHWISCCAEVKFTCLTVHINNVHFVLCYVYTCTLQEGIIRKKLSLVSYYKNAYFSNYE